ncbi:hypothetical protein [Catenuloplanes japonicus]|uniref:hypothetical protein n=1 Tax=Catenuloplanes japonicus TaxID=33876 RepID=UPI000527B550|nr:hypothetical protein [Catenuloplanes japonicus]
MPRSTTTRRITLTAAFLGLAAGGTAACDSSPDTSTKNRSEDLSYYCTDRDYAIVDESKCDNSASSGSSSTPFFLWAGVGARGLRVGQKVPSGGTSFPYNDTAARRAAGLPEYGRVTNGTVRTGVVGKSGADNGSSGG